MEILELLKAVLLGIVQGITEWLPISSTGHMILLDEIIKLHMTDAFKEMFLVLIQLGSIMAVVVLYWHKLWPFSLKKGEYIKKDIFSMWFKILAASIPAGIIGVAFDKKIDQLFYNPWVVSATLIIYGILFIVIENRNKNRKPQIRNTAELTYKTAFIIGIFQMLALIPGTSRSGATIIGAILIGTQRTFAAEFSFYMAVPAMLGASLVKLVHFGFHYTGMEVAVLLTGMLVAFIVSILAIKFLIGYIKKNDFKVFGWYRIALGGLVLFYFAAKALI